MAIERCRVVLSQNEDAHDIRVDAVRHRDVYEAILAAERHGRLGAQAGQREQALADAAAQNDRHYVVHVHRQFLLQRAFLNCAKSINPAQGLRKSHCDNKGARCDKPVSGNAPSALPVAAFGARRLCYQFACDGV